MATDVALDANGDVVLAGHGLVLTDESDVELAFATVQLSPGQNGLAPDAGSDVFALLDAEDADLAAAVEQALEADGFDMATAQVVVSQEGVAVYGRYQ